ncbi:NAD-dependent epimerase/dehydratase family protein [Paenibacillus sp. L3-i20]|uniref:NAD-dependent epimerase/dehydratase family protein n=1 Tax=Paenibacillus sp. L3-i20 TaxID=2905833 RepID=UPI001EDD82BA|nr:NAD-dependent epimerase/dehydratase family protein [Paenibacillus sp. L3-i20]GKU77028.1 UDP-glucose 4-epimerase [Paenibacillus sp. L3-i20]
MKKILITAKNSYLGNSFAEWVGENFDIDFISCRTDEWKSLSFAKYDVIYHVAGIAHIKETKHNKELYFKVNRDLTEKLAIKAKRDCVKQFIFLSSMSVYGIETGIINKDTLAQPKSSYGISKLQGEEQIKLLEDENFKVAIIRPPMIYGKGAKGNYGSLAVLAKRITCFPDITNQRSMLYVDNLCEFIRLTINNNESGLFFPQNSDYVRTSELVQLIANEHGRKIRLTKVFNPILKILEYKLKLINKVFGNLSYDQEISSYRDKYQIYNLKESIKITEKL